MDIMPNVAMNGGRLRKAISAPLIRPMSPAKISEITSVGSTATPQFFIIMAISRPVRAMFEPTDRSIPPEMMTNVMPMAMTKFVEICCNTLSRLLPVRNTGCASCKSRHRTTRAMRIPTMLFAEETLPFLPPWLFLMAGYAKPSTPMSKRSMPTTRKALV